MIDEIVYKGNAPVVRGKGITQESAQTSNFKSQIARRINSLPSDIMGQGGGINLINGTPYDWKKSNQTSYQVNWNFPDIIKSGTTATIYIEWNQGLFVTETDTTANVTYTLGTTAYRFDLQARRPNKAFVVQAYLADIATDNNARGDTINIGFIHDGDVYFILSGSGGNFTSSNMSKPWMQRNLGTLGRRALRDICMPGTHNAGMSTKTDGTALASANNVLCQSVSVLGQLFAGSRYLDIRPVIGGEANEFFTGHYTNAGIVGWQGWSGQSMKDIIGEINAFTALCHELIIINLSHDFNKNAGFRSLYDDEWKRLFRDLTRLNNRYTAPNASTVILSNLPLSSFIGANKAAVIILVDPSLQVPLKAFPNRGFYASSQLNVIDRYSNTIDPQHMIETQITEMKNAPPSAFFLLSWTLTQASLRDVILDDLMVIAEAVNMKLYTKLLPACSRTAFPNVIYIDFIKGANRDIAALAMAVNSLFGP